MAKIRRGKAKKRHYRFKLHCRQGAPTPAFRLANEPSQKKAPIPKDDHDEFDDLDESDGDE